MTIKISGQVQGIFFRAQTQDLASNLDLKGYVENLADGTVLIVVEGEKENLEKLLNWAKNGPELAKVEKVDIKWEKPTGEFESFQIKY